MNKKINVEETIKNILEQEGHEKGINLIRDILNSIVKNKRRKQPRGNTLDSIASRVYNLIYNDHYMRERAIEKVAEDSNIGITTVKNHLYNFDKKAKAIDYMNFGHYCESKVLSDIYTSQNISTYYSVEDFGRMFGFASDESYGYYLKYKIDMLKRKSVFTPEYNINYNPEYIPF